MAATGMRPGEIVALKWSDVDFERKMISIERTRVRSKKGEKPKDGLTKTMSSNRKIDLLPIAEQALLEQMKLTIDETYIFLNQSNEALGDYLSGPSHCLPTGRSARFSSGLSVYDFFKASNIVNLQATDELRKATAILARMEGLEAHACSAENIH